MFVAGNFLSAIAQVTDLVLTMFQYALIIRALLSWVNPDPYNPIVQFLYKVTEPVLGKIREYMPSYSIGIDLSLLAALLIVMFLKVFLVGTLNGLAFRMA